MDNIPWAPPFVIPPDNPNAPALPIIFVPIAAPLDVSSDEESDGEAPEEGDDMDVVAAVKVRPQAAHPRRKGGKKRKRSAEVDGGTKKPRVVKDVAEMTPRERVDKLYRMLRGEIGLYDVQDRMNGEHDDTIPTTVNLTYGELTAGGFQTVLDIFQHQFGFNADSTFYDIGSGFGKPVFHTYMMTGARCAGIEYGETRYEQSVNFLERHAGLIAPGILRAQIPISFTRGDVTNLHTIDYDFVYFYNPLDTPELTDAITVILLRSKFKIYATFQPPHRFPGLERILTWLDDESNTTKRGMRTTGGQTFKVYFYRLPKRD